MRRALLLAAAAAQAAAAGWDDCDAGSLDRKGPFAPAQFANHTYDGTIIYVTYPTGTPPGGKWPVVVFMHGLTGQYEMYQPNIEVFVSHGFVFVFPFIKGPAADARKSPPVTDMQGKTQRKAVEFVSSFLARDPSSELSGLVDTENLALAGHSMGATATIFSAQELPAGTAKVAVAMHPGICGPFGPPPWPSTWLKSQFKEANAKMPILMTTATNDKAFRSAPKTAEAEHACFEGGVNGTAIFAQFSEAACLEDGARAPFNDAGHDCPLKAPGPENKWLLAMLQLYLQQGGSRRSGCYSMLWGATGGSLRNASTVDLVDARP